MKNKTPIPKPMNRSHSSGLVVPPAQIPLRGKGFARLCELVRRLKPVGPARPCARSVLNTLARPRLVIVWLLCVLSLSLTASAQQQASDDFNDQTDTGPQGVWTPYDPAIAGGGAEVRSFPPDGMGGFAYRLYGQAGTNNLALFQRGGSFRQDNTRIFLWRRTSSTMTKVCAATPLSWRPGSRLRVRLPPMAILWVARWAGREISRK